ncbi:MAG: hypothetical protein ACTHQQ_17535 [Solirubrobacteraceae bacterium]
MPTDIYFATENLRVKVDEEPGQVAQAFASANGLPFRLTAPDGHRDVYVNPSMVAFWLVSEPGREPTASPEEASPPTSGREVVTHDIWGRPVRRKSAR